MSCCVANSLRSEGMRVRSYANPIRPISKVSVHPRARVALHHPRLRGRSPGRSRPPGSRRPWCGDGRHHPGGAGNWARNPPPAGGPDATETAPFGRWRRAGRRRLGAQFRPQSFAWGYPQRLLMGAHRRSCTMLDPLPRGLCPGDGHRREGNGAGSGSDCDRCVTAVKPGAVAVL
ncbi:Exonuclease SbcC [Actinacidiphila bryophytorum]|uniref:Exonuclease SbcC n=1 Tax=Actinacidiphila bryophytorum TaxID=1436133 RepID=A0A9W4H555_9ACTN|nr:Exonuclease SbcC [Actinacidiphila bryophytorum]